MNTPDLTRRSVLLGGAGLATAFALAACTGGPNLLTATSAPVTAAERARRRTGRTTRVQLTAGKTNIDLAARTASTWAYNGQVPGPTIRATAGDAIRAHVTNHLPDDTTVHWHGIALRNDMDGVPPITQHAIAPGSSFDYEFTADAPGTYWYHPHVGPQLDRGLQGPLIVEDPHEPLGYDHDWVLVLDDWLDGVTATPDQVLAELKKGMSMGGMGGMGGGMGGGAPSRNGKLLTGTTSSLLGGDSGDVYYPYYLINGRPAEDPATFTAKPGQRVRLRIINAGGDTAFRFSVGGHRLTVTHTDGYPVNPVTGDSILLGMGERYDAIITVADGAFPIVADAVGKAARAFAVLRSNPGSPAPTVNGYTASDTSPVTAAVLSAPPAAALRRRGIDRRIDIALTGGMMKYDWGINGKAFDMNNPLDGAYAVREGERVQVTIANQTMMWHPFHIHGHTFQLDGGPRKDTAIVLPHQSLTVLFDADNPGLWMTHCHNIYHAESGMMAVLGYEQS
ncbi:copper oxidase [Leifsonia xyli]|jgi:FtsP/CotA-like multicopper oxidase with cupredoxin domain|uniref:FtsP/CotA-like multicopper oxidase with cupredoxin domain n=1 Tax=Leifsonia soli TaxID=582665 RepID=A0A852T263_9MICO|nr:multicopper oxidase family protein [Leifsonia soli]ANF31871.1 copper oxidase [Leifsonia xyli]NYD74943.1 FtsP/CotA-like multicopper oxidase with cupredoxin domain [Leifsonia soli]